MATLTSIEKKGKKGERYVVSLDNRPLCTLELESIVKAGLKVGMEIDEEKILQIQFENEKILAFNLALKLVSKNLKTEKEVVQYLKNKGYSFGVIEYVSQKLKEYKYVNDSSYASLFCKCNQSTKGKRMLGYQLKNKGVSENIINNALGEIENEFENALGYAKKYVKNKPLDDKLKIRLGNNLLARGFSYGDVKKAVQVIFKGKIMKVGIDLVEIERVKKIPNERIGEVFFEAEAFYARKYSDPATHFAGFFAVKEAVLKAIGMGINKLGNFKEIEILHSDKNAPFVKLYGEVLEEFNKLDHKEISVSISHTQEYANAICIIL